MGEESRATAGKVGEVEEGFLWGGETNPFTRPLETSEELRGHMVNRIGRCRRHDGLRASQRDDVHDLGDLLDHAAQMERRVER